MARKILPIIIILSLMFPSFAQVSKAQEQEGVGSFISCAAAGFISNLIREGLNDLIKFVKDFLGNFIKNLFGILFESVVPVHDEKFHSTFTEKEFVEDIIARCLAREILAVMGKNITNIARLGGRNGGPAWVRNWRNFQMDAQYRGEDIFRGVLNSTNLCGYFGDDLKGLFGATETVDLTSILTRVSDLDSFQVKAGCTLPDNFDFNAYKNDFSGNGGWEAWSNLLEPQNNFYGSLFVSLDEADKQRAVEESTDLNEAGPTGFTSIRGQGATKNCLISSPSNSGRCLIYKDILTPGNIISGAVLGGIESELQWIASTDELNEIVASGINIVLSRLLNLSEPNEGTYVIPPKPSISPSPSPSPSPTATTPLSL